MRKLIFILLLCLVSLSFGQFAPQQKPVLGTQINWGTTHGLVGCWLMNEGYGDKVYDLSGNGNTGTVNGLTRTAGLFGPGLVSQFGQDDYITVTSRAYTNWTFVLWIYKDASEGGWYIPLGDNTSSNYCGFADTGEFRCVAGGTTMKITGLSVGDNVWEQWVVSYNGIRPSFYVNGVFVGADPAGDIAGKTFTLSYLLEGLNGFNPSAILDHVITYDRALTASEINKLYSDPFYMLRPSFELFLFGAISVPSVGGGQVILVNIN